MSFWPITDDERAGIERIAAALEKIDIATDGWTSKGEARQTGASMHFRFEKKTDVMTAMEFMGIVEQAPGLLANVCARVLAADDERKAAAS